MGFDMRTVQPVDSRDPVKIAAAQAQVRDLAKEIETTTGSMPQVNKAAEYAEAVALLREAQEPGYFRLNNYGMRVCVNVMLDTGMAHRTNCPVTAEEWAELAQITDTTEYERRRTLLVARHLPPEETIPTHKFSTNDGWHVTPDEIRAALTAWEHYQQTTPEPQQQETIDQLGADYWESWVRYLTTAETHGGFHVH